MGTQNAALTSLSLYEKQKEDLVAATVWPIRLPNWSNSMASFGPKLAHTSDSVDVAKNLSDSGPRASPKRPRRGQNKNPKRRHKGPNEAPREAAKGPEEALWGLSGRLRRQFASGPLGRTL